MNPQEPQEAKVNYPTGPRSKDPHYPRWVENPNMEKRTCPECEAKTTHLGKVFRAEVNCSTCHGLGHIPNRVLAQNHTHHSSIVGKEYGPDARPVNPEPPTLEEVMATGAYSRSAAESIVAREQAMFDAGYPPYGTTPFPTAPKPTPQQPQTPAPAGGQVIPEMEF